MLNQPARLSLTVDPITAADGAAIPLTGDVDGSDYEPVQLTRETTNQKRRASALDKVLEDKQNLPMLEKLQAMFDDDDAACLKDPAMQKFLLEMADSCDMPDTSKEMKERHVSEMLLLFRALRRGATAAGTLAQSFTAGSVGAVLELADVAGDMPRHARRVFKGRTIHVQVGSRVTASVLKQNGQADAPTH
jgi:hypothetical protein